MTPSQRAAQDPETPASKLSTLAKIKKLRQFVAVNPNADLPTLRKLSEIYPYLVQQNPALVMFDLEHPEHPQLRGIWYYVSRWEIERGVVLLSQPARFSYLEHLLRLYEGSDKEVYLSLAELVSNLQKGRSYEGHLQYLNRPYILIYNEYVDRVVRDIEHLAEPEAEPVISETSRSRSSSCEPNLSELISRMIFGTSLHLEWIDVLRASLPYLRELLAPPVTS